MNIGKDNVVTFHYTLTDSSGEVLDSSHGRGPLTYLHGHGNIIPGLESRLEGLSAGATTTLSVPAAEAYGEREKGLEFEVDRSQFPADADLSVGEHVMSSGPGEPRVFTVMAANDQKVMLDANHPLAGRDLHFAVEVVDVREATPQELTHGHAHDGTDGH